MSLITRSTVTALELFRERIAMSTKDEPCDGTRRGCYCARCLDRIRREDAQYEALRQSNVPRSVPWWMDARD